MSASESRSMEKPSDNGKEDSTSVPNEQKRHSLSDKSTNYTKKTEIDGKKLKEGQTALEKLVHKDSHYYWNELTDSDKRVCIQTWSIVFKRRKQLVQAFSASLLNDPDLEEGTTTFKGVDLAIVVDAWNHIVNVIAGIDSDDNTSVSDEDFDDDNKKKRRKSVEGAAAITLEDSEVAFNSIRDYLERVIQIHIEMEVDPHDLLETRKHLLSTLRKDLGGAWTADAKSAWSKLTAFVMMTLISRSSKDPIVPPTKDEVKLVNRTWAYVEQNQQSAQEVFFQVLFQASQEVKEIFEDAGNVTMIALFGRVINVAEQMDIFVPMLHELGTKHQEFNVKPSHFVKAKGAFWAMLEHSLGAMWDETVQQAWNKVWTFATGIMCASLREAWMLHLPPEPSNIRGSVVINHIKNINPVLLNYYADVLFDFYNGAIPSQKFAFDKGETNKAIIGKLPYTVRLANGEEVEDMYQNAHLPAVAKLDETTFYQRGHLQGKFSQYFDLRAYPFDSHFLRMYFELDVPMHSARFDKDLIKVSMGESSKMFGIGGTDWNVYEPSYFVQKVKENRKKYHRLVVSVPIARRFSNFIYQVLFPLLLIDAVAFQIYFIEILPVFYRMNCFVPLLLTLFAFKWTLSSSVPPVPYITNMDRNFNTSYLFFFIHTSVTLVPRLAEAIYRPYTFTDHLIIFSIVLFSYCVVRVWVLRNCWSNTQLNHLVGADAVTLINSHEQLRKRNYQNADNGEELSVSSSTSKSGVSQGAGSEKEESVSSTQGTSNNI